MLNRAKLIELSFEMPQFLLLMWLNPALESMSTSPEDDTNWIK